MRRAPRQGAQGRLSPGARFRRIGKSGNLEKGPRRFCHQRRQAHRARFLIEELSGVAAWLWFPGGGRRRGRGQRQKSPLHRHRSDRWQRRPISCSTHSPFRHLDQAGARRPDGGGHRSQSGRSPMTFTMPGDSRWRRLSGNDQAAAGAPCSARNWRCSVFATRRTLPFLGRREVMPAPCAEVTALMNVSSRHPPLQRRLAGHGSYVAGRPILTVSRKEATFSPGMLAAGIEAGARGPGGIVGDLDGGVDMRSIPGTHFCAPMNICSPSF